MSNNLKSRLSPCFKTPLWSPLGKGRKGAGFTLIEIMIAVAIFAVLSSIMILNFRVDAKSKELKNDCQKITDALKQAQTMALSGRQVADNSGQTFIPNGYEFVPSSCSGSACRSINLIASTSINNIPVLGVIQLEKSEIYSPNGLIITFFPPSADSQILINGNSTTSVQIKVEHILDPNLSKCIIYNSISGRMDILNSNSCN